MIPKHVVRGYDHRFLFLIIGRSGSGKDTFVQALTQEYPRLTQIKSYTTRPQRNDQDNGHTYISLDPDLTVEENFQQIRAKYDIVAETVFDNNLYFADTQMVDCGDIWIVDPRGLRQLKKSYRGDKLLVSIYLDTHRNLCYRRMLQRGDNKKDAFRRLFNDDTEFRDVENEVSIVLHSTDVESRLAEFDNIFGDFIWGETR